MKHQLTNSKTINPPQWESQSVGFRPSTSGVIRHGVHPSKIGTFRVHLTLPPPLTQRLHVHKGKMSERWIRQVMVAAAYATPFHSLFQQPFSLSLFIPLYHLYPSPIRAFTPQPPANVRRRFFVIKRWTATKIKSRPGNASRNRPGVGRPHRQCAPVSLL